jgi:hypothetical protein
MSEYRTKGRSHRKSRDDDDDDENEFTINGNNNDDENEEVSESEEEEMTRRDNNDNDDDDWVEKPVNDEDNPYSYSLGPGQTFYNSSSSIVSEAKKSGFNVIYLNFINANRLSAMEDKITLTCEDGLPEDLRRSQCDIAQIYVTSVQNQFPVNIAVDIEGVNAEFDREVLGATNAHYIAIKGKSKDYDNARPMIHTRNLTSDKFVNKYPTLSEKAIQEAFGTAPISNKLISQKMNNKSNAGNKKSVKAKTEVRYSAEKNGFIQDYLDHTGRNYSKDKNYIYVDEKTKNQITEELTAKIGQAHITKLQNIKAVISKCCVQKNSDSKKWSDIKELCIGESAADKQNAERILASPYQFHMKVAVVYKLVDEDEE